MITKKEKYYKVKKQITKFTVLQNDYDIELRKKTTYWLFWIIPIFTTDIVVKSNR